MTKKEFTALKSCMDGWIEDFQAELSVYREMPEIIQEQDENINHNYELIHEMRSEIRKLKEELNALKMMHLISLKAELQKKI